MHKPVSRGRRGKDHEHRRRPASSSEGSNHRSNAHPNCVSPEDNALLTTSRWTLAAAAGLLSAAFLWSYWPTLVALVRAWDTQPDYSHGFFVVPLAIYFLWDRRDQFPGLSLYHRLWPGVALLCAAATMRFAAAQYFLQPIDGWSILLWAAGIAWLLGGWRWLRWSLPSIAFLLFMIPLPFRVERWLSNPLQSIAAKLSGWALQCFGLPALTEGNTILLREQTLEVEQACSGLRIFVGIAALAFAYMVLTRRSWWEKIVLAASVLPIALIANSARIVFTGLLQEYASDELASRFSHDLAGWLMLPLAALMFAVTLWYIDKLLPRTEQLDVRGMIRQSALAPPTGNGPMN